MPPLVAEALGSLIRAGLGVLTGALVTRGLWTQEAAATYVAALTVFLLSYGWSIWQKVLARQKFLTALALPKGSTEVQVNQKVADGAAPPVTTPPDKPPAVR